MSSRSKTNLYKLDSNIETQREVTEDSVRLDVQQMINIPDTQEISAVTHLPKEQITAASDAHREDSSENQREEGDEPELPELRKLNFEQNVAPAHLMHHRQKLNINFKYKGSKILDWLSLRQEDFNNRKQILDLASDLSVSCGSLSHPKQQQYSIFEAEPCEILRSDSDKDFPVAEPSEQSKGTHAPVLIQKGYNNLLSYVVFTLLSLTNIGLFVSQCVSQNAALICYFSLANVASAYLYMLIMKVGFDNYDGYLKFTTGKLLQLSSALAKDLPKTLMTECGHAKFLKQQYVRPYALIVLSYSLFGVLLLFSTVPLSLHGSNVMPLVFNIFTNLTPTTAGLIFYGISILLSVVMFANNQYIRHCSKNGLNLAKKSILCNLRGFLLNQNYALDFSDQHQIDEGLCYIFDSPQINKLPQLFIPYLAVVDAFIHLEPYQVKVIKDFTNKEIDQFDTRHDKQAQEILKRKYDHFTFDDVLIWVVLQLQNGVKIWLPLSPTQLQTTDYVEDSYFGYTGNELSTILRMIASQQREEEEDDVANSLEKVASFCFQYESLRIASLNEEIMHIPMLDKIFIPIAE